MTEEQRETHPTVFLVILEDYNKIQKKIASSRKRLRESEAKKRKLRKAMSELGYPLEGDIDG